ncbi:MAG TPA: hypothetical protein VED86_07480, partial [archaeon]|nr:hypothetical protein [archaeon]
LRLTESLASITRKIVGKDLLFALSDSVGLGGAHVYASQPQRIYEAYLETFHPFSHFKTATYIEKGNVNLSVDTLGCKFSVDRVRLRLRLRESKLKATTSGLRSYRMHP